MDENEHAQLHLNEQLQQLKGARELLDASKRHLQLIDEHVALLQRDGRVAVQPATDTSYEHRVGWIGVVDDNDGEDGILIVDASSLPATVGFGNPKTGTIRNQADAVFVVSRILVAVQDRNDTIPTDADFTEGFGTQIGSGLNIMMRLTDSATGRNLVPGTTVAPLSRDRGAVPLSYFSSARRGAGPQEKNALFSEFVLPRAATVKVELYNMALASSDAEVNRRAFIALFGEKVYGA